MKEHCHAFSAKIDETCVMIVNSPLILSKICVKVKVSVYLQTPIHSTDSINATEDITWNFP